MIIRAMPTMLFKQKPPGTDMDIIIRMLPPSRTLNVAHDMILALSCTLNYRHNNLNPHYDHDLIIRHSPIPSPNLYTHTPPQNRPVNSGSTTSMLMLMIMSVVDMEMSMDMVMEGERGNASIRMVDTLPRTRCRHSDIVCHPLNMDRRLARIHKLKAVDLEVPMTPMRTRATWKITPRLGESKIVPAPLPVRIAPVQAKTRKRREGGGLGTESLRF